MQFEYKYMVRQKEQVKEKLERLVGLGWTSGVRFKRLNFILEASWQSQKGCRQRSFGLRRKIIVTMFLIMLYLF